MFSAQLSKAPGTRIPFPAKTLIALLVLLTGMSGQAQTTLRPESLTRFDSVLDESSGIAIHGESIWTHNDSGDVARIFELDLQGELQREVRINNAENVDWEAMASDEDYLYVADTGNNANTRSTLTIYRLSWTDLLADTASAELIHIDYGDYVSGRRLSHNFDAEGLAVQGEELWLFSKNRGDRNTKLYRFPKTPGHYRPQPSQTFAVNSLVTGADIHPETGAVVLISSRRLRENFIWWAPASAEGVDWQQMQMRRIEPADQWEAIHWDPTNPRRIYLSHENNERGYAGLATLELD